jgi:hypothetical protein
MKAWTEDFEDGQWIVRFEKALRPIGRHIFEDRKIHAVEADQVLFAELENASLK